MTCSCTNPASCRAIDKSPWARPRHCQLNAALEEKAKADAAAPPPMRAQPPIDGKQCCNPQTVHYGYGSAQVQPEKPCPNCPLSANPARTNQAPKDTRPIADQYEAIKRGMDAIAKEKPSGRADWKLDADLRARGLVPMSREECEARTVGVFDWGAAAAPDGDKTVVCNYRAAYINTPALSATDAVALAHKLSRARGLIVRTKADVVRDMEAIFARNDDGRRDLPETDLVAFRELEIEFRKLFDADQTARAKDAVALAHKLSRASAYGKFAPRQREYIEGLRDDEGNVELIDVSHF